MRTNFIRAFLMIYMVLDLYKAHDLLYGAIGGGSLVKTNNGMMFVEDLTLEDKIVVFDKSASKICTAPIASFKKVHFAFIYFIKVTNSLILASWDQLFYDPDKKKIVQAQALTNGHKILTASGKIVTCERVEKLNMGISGIELCSITFEKGDNYVVLLEI